MHMNRGGVGIVVLAALALSAAASAAADSDASHAHMHGAGGASPRAPLFNNLGNFHRAITTKSPQAQRYFDQGLRLMWGFNLEEAQRSFEEAARLDTTCASCSWGVAFSLGPHINLPGIPERTKPAYHAAERALALESGASDVERALIEAMVKRYSDPPPADPRGQFALDSSYAAAMREVARRFPDDNDVQALSMEALMDLHPWDYWTSDGKEQPWTGEIVGGLEQILARDPRHPGANHYYIHAVEASPHPEKALPCADRLRDMMPGAGHMVHMPAHIYQRVGRYDDANAANRKAVDSDKAYAAVAKPQGFYHMYMSHNSHFLCWTYMVQGRSAEAIRASRAAALEVPPEMARAMAGTDFFIAEPMFAMARFGKWDDLLKEPAPPGGLPYMRGIWHYTRGLAFAATGRLEEAQRSRDSLAAIRDATPEDAVEDLNSAKALLSIALEVLAGETALKRGDNAEAVKHLEEAVKGEDASHYSEAADWLYPARHHLGKALLAAGRAAEAEAVYREDLKRYPENGWSLYGLARSLSAQGKTAEAADAEARFKRAWAKADVKITASAF